jgi:hypothetical protein
LFPKPIMKPTTSSKLAFKSIWALTILTSISCSTLKSNNNPGWIDLFNGKDIKDWNVKINHHELGDNYANTFRVEDGMIKVRYDQYGAYNNQFGHLYYKKPFSHYRLRVEYRITGDWKTDAPSYTVSNSGIMFHSQDPKTMLKDQDWPISIEFQLLAGLEDGQPRPTGNMCSPGTDVIYEGKIDSRHCIDSKSKTFKKDEWVQAELIVLGDSLITHLINGDTVLQYSKPQIGGGVVNNFDPAIKLDGKLLREGFIALQSEGQPVDFRKIQIINLDKHTKK